MNTRLCLSTFVTSMLLPVLLADNVTVHGTVGMLEAQLVTGNMEQVGVVEVWNDKDYVKIRVTPDSDRCLLRRVNIYMSTEAAPPPISTAALQLADDYEALLADCEALLDEVPDWLENHQRYFDDEHFGNEPFEDVLSMYEALVGEYQALVAGLLADDPVLWLACQEGLNDYIESILDYQEVLAEPDFGEWPGARFDPATGEPYELEVEFSEIQNLRWGPWGAPWLNERLVTVAVRVQLKTTDVVPVTFDAWALNPFVPLEGQRTAWGENTLAMRYELQHPAHGQFAGPVHGLGYRTQTHGGIMEEASADGPGGFWFYPGERIDLFVGDVFIGSALADHHISPLEIFPTQDIDDPAVVNMALLLLSLDADPDNGAIDITDDSVAALENVMPSDLSEIDFADGSQMEALLTALGSTVSAEEALDWLEKAIGSRLMRRNISKSPEYAVDKPKLDIFPVWVPARTASGESATVDYYDDDGNVIEERDKVKPLVVTYTEKQEPNTSAGITRSGSDIITAVSMDDGATWKRFNVSHMARKSSFTLETGERFPGDCRGPKQRILGEKILVAWESAYARGGKPSFAIKTVEEGDDYTYDDPYAVNDIWGVRGRQGSVNYDLDKDVGDEGIGEIPYYAVWACRGVLVYSGNASRFPDYEIGDIVWFKPERLTSGRRDAFFTMVHGSKGTYGGFAVAWQEDPGGLLPGSCKGGGQGWSGATVHKKTDIWYSFITWGNFDQIDPYWDPSAQHSEDELGGGPDAHGQQPELSNRAKWLVPMSLPVRISDNNTVNTDNLKVQLDPETGLPLPGYIPLDGAEEEDYLATEYEGVGGCDDGDGDGDGGGDGDHSGQNGVGGGWGMARYAPILGLVDVDLDSTAPIWDKSLAGDYRPDSGNRWYRFVNRAGLEKTVAVTADGRPLDGDTGACRPALMVMSPGWVILGYEETKGLGIPPEGEHGEDDDVTRSEPDDKGKNIIYHSFRLDQPELVSAGRVLNLPALDDAGDLIPIYYKDAAGESTDIFMQYKTENARRIRFIAQPKEWLSRYGSQSKTVMVSIYRQGREGNGKPSDVFAVRTVVPPGDTGNPYKWENLVRYDTGTETTAETSDPAVMRGGRRHMNMSAATVLSMDPVERASDGEGNEWAKVGKWKQYGQNLSDESFANPYSDAKAHRGFLRGDLFVFGYSFTPNWGRLGGDHMDFYVRRSFDGGQSFTVDPGRADPTIHRVLERNPDTGEFEEKQYCYGPYGAGGEEAFEPGRNVSSLKGNSHTVIDPRLVPPMGPGTINSADGYPEDDIDQDPTDPTNFTYYVAFGTAKVLHGLGEPLGATDVEREDAFYTRTTDGGSTFYQVPWVINPDSSSPAGGETVYRWPWLAKGPPHQGHVQIRMHPSGTRLYAIWHQFTHGDEDHLSPHDIGDDIWFRRIDFMTPMQ